MIGLVLSAALAAAAVCHPITIAAVVAADAPGARSMPTGDGALSVSAHALATQTQITGANVSVTEGQVVLNVNLDAVGGRSLRDFTAAHVGARIAFIYDGHVLRAPKILDPLKGDGFLLGPLDRDEADRLAREINAGAPACRAPSA